MFQKWFFFLHQYQLERFFIWLMMSRNRPKIPELLSNEHAFREVVYNFHWRFNQYLQNFLQIASGSDPVHFFVVIISLYIISVIGSYCDFVNLLFFGMLLISVCWL